MVYQPTLATLGYVLSPDGASVLLLHRNSRPDDEHYGKYNGLGGKVERYEDVASGLRRELREEASIEAHTLLLRGTINWPDFGPYQRDWFAFIFRIDTWSGTPPAHNPEGTLEWVPIEQLETIPMWPGDRLFLPLVLGNDPRQFHGTMRYDGEQPVTWHYEWM